MTDLVDMPPDVAEPLHRSSMAADRQVSSSVQQREFLEMDADCDIVARAPKPASAPIC